MIKNVYFIAAACLVIGSAHTRNDEEQDYENYKLIQIKPQTTNDVELVQRFEGLSKNIEVLKPSRGVNDTVDLLVAPESADELIHFAQTRRLNVNVKVQNYRRSLDEEELTRRAYRRSFGPQAFDVTSYNDYKSILEFQKQLAQEYPQCVSVEALGNSFEGRPMLLTKISRRRNNINPIIFVDAGIHAREWVAPAMAAYLMDRLARACGSNNEDSVMLQDVDWFILPLVNPDGYEFSRQGNRMWRKTRSNYVRQCHGVDGNRNYGYKWGEVGVSRNPCDMQTYAGPKPFSEVETRMVRDVLLDHRDRIKLYVSLHAYGQYLVYPWGYTGEVLPGRWKDLDNLANRVSDAVVNAGGKPFRVMSAGKWYAAAGGSDDYAFAVAKIPYSYTMELTDGYDFKFPENQLEAVLPTFFEGFRTFSGHIAKRYA